MNIILDMEGGSLKENNECENSLWWQQSRKLLESVSSHTNQASYCFIMAEGTHDKKQHNGGLKKDCSVE